MTVQVFLSHVLDNFEDSWSVVLYNILQFRFVWKFLRIRLRLCIFYKTTTEMMLCLSQCFITESKWFWCLIISVNFDHFVKLVFAKYFHFIVTTFPFLINKCLIGRYFEIMQKSFFFSSYFCPLILTFISEPCLQLLLLPCFPSDNFSFLPFFPHCLIEVSF